AMLRRWPLWAIALIVGFATAARPVGVALLAPFAIHICRRTYAADAQRLSTRERSRAGGAKQAACVAPSAVGLWFVIPAIRRLALYLPLACWGLGLFMAYQYRAFGEPLAFVTVQKNWGTPAAWPEKAIALATLRPVWSVYDATSRACWTQHEPHRIPWFSLQFANPIFFVSGVALIAFGAFRPFANSLGDDARSRRWLSSEETSLGALLLLIPYVTRPCEMDMGSMGRFVAAVLPVYLVLGQLLVRVPGPLRAALLTLSGFFLATYTALYAARYPIF
ncbi:MAG: hypothetical protein ACREHD_24565, partial [Pirellulales bacterium]